MIKLLKPREVAEILSVSYQTVLGLIHIGDLKAYRIRSHLRVPEDEVQRYLESDEVKVSRRPKWQPEVRSLANWKP